MQDLRSAIQHGLYDPNYEHDACGVGMVLHMKGAKSHAIVENGLRVLENMTHRGAENADNKTGDGAGIMLQIPHEFILLQGIPVPEKGHYGTGLVFLPKGEAEMESCMITLTQYIDKEGLKLLAVRDVPVNSEILGEMAKSNEPHIKQIFVLGEEGLSQDELEHKLYLLRKKIEKEIFNSKIFSLETKRAFYIVSLSTKRLIYKGMLSSEQLRHYYPDLLNPHLTSAIALVHSRFSTNTFPTWDLAHPFRMVAHNGEINTIKGNRLWMEARESILKSDLLGNINDLWPIVQPFMSDSASFDNVLEFLVMSGKSLPHAMAMMVPESWNDQNPISDDLKAFYEYHSLFMEPWDGPATLLFSDGRYAGGLLDRNGLRPARYLITHNDVMVVASEMGVLPFEPSEIKEKGRLRPGKILMVDTEKGTIQYDAELKENLAKAYPYREWLSKNRISLDDISSGRAPKYSVDNYDKLLKVFGYYKEDIEKIMTPMAVEGKEPTASMGNDAPVAVLSNKPQRLFTYFRQLFAQVTNPPIDPIREELVMSLAGYIGSLHKNILEPMPEHTKMVGLSNPFLSNRELDLLVHLGYKGFKAEIIPMLFDPKQGGAGLEKAIEQMCRNAEKAVDRGSNYIVLSDRGVNPDNAAIPSLLAVSAVHHYLIERRKRMQIDIVVESAEPREVMHFALLFGYGANAVNPYLALAVIEDLVKKGDIHLDFHTAMKNYVKSINKGLLKTMSKMGISTLKSYIGAQIFEAVGISTGVIDKYFKGTTSKIEGIDINDIASDTIEAFYEAFESDFIDPSLVSQGIYAWRRNGEYHAWNPETIMNLQMATRLGSYKKFKEYTDSIDKKTEKIFLRDFLDFDPSKNPIDVSEVEPVSAITKRFVTGAMSFGSISREAHEAMAVAMNAIGGKSNTGEGGELPERFATNARSSIKQVASGRFGVTTEYLVNADELQIKIAQGAKPGEGGQLPGFKVDKIIAKTRHSIPGISLISPPPHHDIYSIEDLAQLIFDLKNVNPAAQISVKLVSESGVGTIAAGVAKAKADRIVISGCEGGTGASPASSIKHAGLPLEIGLAEVQQTLVLNGLRGQVYLQTDGQLKTGHDIIVAAMLGAEEFGFATSALIVLGCIMMRKCHLNTCPVGVATQNEELRKKFMGRSEYLINYFNFLAEEVREHLAALGVKSLDEVVGRADLLKYMKSDANKKVEKLDLSRLMYFPVEAKENAIHRIKDQEHKLDDALDISLITTSRMAIDKAMPTVMTKTIKNTNRTVGAMLSGEIAKKYGNAGLPEDTIQFTFTGSAGQSFGAFLAHGVTFKLEGDANDYVGKGLSGGKIIIVPPTTSTFKPEENIIAGNTLLYGATSGEIYINGRVGERFCVRNSGAVAVVEGAGDHCCEYMTGGRTVVLGKTGRNFAAGMSGGVAYVYNIDEDFDYYCNMQMVELTLIEDTYDSRELRQLITNHYNYTNSPLAKYILDNWNTEVEKFMKVTPIEYKKVLQDDKLEAIKKKIAQVEFDY
ncbi:glutamate synthase large subunit [Dysgonomonas mossii]|uniref:Glutamate synthase [NADPH] large chain n=2 Tax=Dysgonomonas TaxID=156973 RepID=A0A4Y9IR13_9BACT|nr:glutamate synthase large subunit [Dysgonomonas mossii]MBF0759863.1 glutamate synthase large subunit [Dysgonomonas mossii]TFU90821.1 glutamate synthase large subunit [Dysgonomonas mossii]